MVHRFHHIVNRIQDFKNWLAVEGLGNLANVTQLVSGRAGLALRFPNSLPSSEGRYLLMSPSALGTHAGVDVAKGVAQFSASRCNIWSNYGYECYQDVSPQIFLNIYFVSGSR